MLTGTSLYHYATFDSGWSHAFSFALVAAFLERLDAWKPASRRAALSAVGVGLMAGLIALVRHPNLILPGCFASAVIIGRTEMRAAVLRDAAFAAATAAVVIAPQLCIYHWATRQWLISAYGNQGGFSFASPHLFGVLVSSEKGVFFWAPVLAIAVAGFIVMPRPLRRCARRRSSFSRSARI